MEGEFAKVTANRKYDQMIESWKVNYSEFVAEAGSGPYDDIADYLIGQFEWEWKDQYIANTPFKTDIERYPESSFCYLFDSAVVEEGDAKIKEGRIVAVYGRVCGNDGMKFTSSQIRGRCMGPTEKWIGKVDKGHFIAHTLGGGSNMNIFPQVRELNRGWSAAGKLFREMERYAAARPGLLVFNRPIYADGSLWPRFFEFGVLKPEGDLWLEVFDNKRPAGVLI